MNRLFCGLVLGACIVAAGASAATTATVRPTHPGIVVSGEDGNHLEAIIPEFSDATHKFPVIAWAFLSKSQEYPGVQFSIIVGKIDCANRRWSVMGLVRLNKNGQQVESLPIPVAPDDDPMYSSQPFDADTFSPTYFCDDMHGSTVANGDKAGGTTGIASWTTEVRQQWQGEAQ